MTRGGLGERENWLVIWEIQWRKCCGTSGMSLCTNQRKAISDGEKAVDKGWGGGM